MLRHPYFVIDLTKFGNLSTGHTLFNLFFLFLSCFQFFFLF
ncbi:hypothetical protein XBFFL1_2500005 [Xenorhabdus bovienii str. feltiae Florida]|nr:hypothetical protein XBFFR1_220001 [Xenorhabdus bovienii str. feltiae France]CDG93363.1 hypothetical protein XBFFL1_2500005 [Xenorhabdus bovienii str. feltiae Florida]